MSGADWVIGWSTALAVLGVPAVAAVASYEHAYDLVSGLGETGWTARDAGLSAPQGAGSHVGAVAPRFGHRGDARSQQVHGLGYGPVGAAVAGCRCADGSDRASMRSSK